MENYALLKPSTLANDFKRFLLAMSDDEGCLYDKYTPHSVRHASLSHLYSGGYDLDKLMVHCNIKCKNTCMSTYCRPVLSLCILPASVFSRDQCTSFALALRACFDVWWTNVKDDKEKQMQYLLIDYGSMKKLPTMPKKNDKDKL